MNKLMKIEWVSEWVSEWSPFETLRNLMNDYVIHELKSDGREEIVCCPYGQKSIIFVKRSPPFQKYEQGKQQARRSLNTLSLRGTVIVVTSVVNKLVEIALVNSIVLVYCTAPKSNGLFLHVSKKYAQVIW